VKYLCGNCFVEIQRAVHIQKRDIIQDRLCGRGALRLLLQGELWAVHVADAGVDGQSDVAREALEGRLRDLEQGQANGEPAVGKVSVSINTGSGNYISAHCARIGPREGKNTVTRTVSDPQVAP
jgi:hypothetical protein